MVLEFSQSPGLSLLAALNLPRVVLANNPLPHQRKPFQASQSVLFQTLIDTLNTGVASQVPWVALELVGGGVVHQEYTSGDHCVCWVSLNQTCKQSNRSNRKVIDWNQLRCNSNSNRLKFFKCNSNSNSNRLKFYLLHLLFSIIFLLQFTLCYFSEGGCRKMIT